MDSDLRPGLPRAALFDWDNTLVENWRSIQAALNEALADAGQQPFDLDQVKATARFSGREVFPRLFGADWPRQREIFLAHFRQNHLAGLQIMPGAEELLDAFEEHGIPVGIVSNKLGELLRREVAYLGWSSRFRGIVGAQDAVADKPDPAPVHLLLNHMRIEANPDVWLVGDTDVDIRAGLAAGCSAVLVGAGPEDPTLLDGAAPSFRFRNCVDLAGFVRGARDTISLES